ncbi:MAG: hypothetical protein R2731_00410 [Nocardioides sp.]
MAGSTLSLDEAAELTRTGDLWLFRGITAADHAIRLATNAPVNHVALAVVIDDLPAMMWHAELGKRLVDLWTGTHHRGAQLHDLRAAVIRWTRARSQRVFVRQLHPEPGRAEEDAALRAVARWNGTSFPSTAALALRWFSGRNRIPNPQLPPALRTEVAYCAELAAHTLQGMGVLADELPATWYDPGRFWSGDALPLTNDWTYGEEIEVDPGRAPA